MEIINPPSKKQSGMPMWVVILLCCGVIALTYLGLSLAGRSSSQPALMSFEAKPTAAPQEPKAQQPPADQEQERMLISAPKEMTTTPAAAAAPAAPPKTAAVTQPEAATVKKPVKHLVPVRPLWSQPPRRIMTYRTQPPDSRGAPTAPAADAPEAGNQQQPVAGTPATVARYGVTTRDQIMGQAAGPVYNLKGRGLKAAGSPVEASGATTKNKTQVDDKQDGSESEGQ